MILLTGATGNVGGEVARQLNTTDIPFRIHVLDRASQLGSSR